MYFFMMLSLRTKLEFFSLKWMHYILVGIFLKYIDLELNPRHCHLSIVQKNFNSKHVFKIIECYLFSIYPNCVFSPTAALISWATLLLRYLRTHGAPRLRLYQPFLLLELSCPFYVPIFQTNHHFGTGCLVLLIGWFG